MGRGVDSVLESDIVQEVQLVYDVETGNVDAVMDGSIDTFINGYLKWINLKPGSEN